MSGPVNAENKLLHCRICFIHFLGLTSPRKVFIYGLLLHSTATLLNEVVRGVLSVVRGHNTAFPDTPNLMISHDACRSTERKDTFLAQQRSYDGTTASFSLPFRWACLQGLAFSP